MSKDWSRGKGVLVSIECEWQVARCEGRKRRCLWRHSLQACFIKHYSSCRATASFSTPTFLAELFLCEWVVFIRLWPQGGGDVEHPPCLNPAFTILAVNGYTSSCIGYKVFESTRNITAPTSISLLDTCVSWRVMLLEAER